MKKKTYIYPVVLYYDKTTEYYTVAIHDLNIYTESATVEEAFMEAKEHARVYFDYIDETHEDIIPASKYIDVYFKNNKDENIVILIDVEK